MTERARRALEWVSKAAVTVAFLAVCAMVFFMVVSLTLFAMIAAVVFILAFAVNAVTIIYLASTQ